MKILPEEFKPSLDIPDITQEFITAVESSPETPPETAQEEIEAATIGSNGLHRHLRAMMQHADKDDADHARERLMALVD